MKYTRFKFRIKFDLTKPNGIRRKILDISIANKHGWFPKTDLKSGFFKTYEKYLLR